MKTGSDYQGNGICSFTLWAPLTKTVQLHIVSPKNRVLEMEKSQEGYFTLQAENIYPGTTYYYRLDGGKDLPDPASHYQPDGIHGPSQVINHGAYQWKDTHWQGMAFKDMIMYELHVGTFTGEGTFQAIIPRLDALCEVGINAIELMPVSQFPGQRNWGYDGVFPYSVQNSYSSPDDLKTLVDACHQRGMAVFLDVVYNHLGPEGNYFKNFGPYFTDKYCTPWGDALNYDGEWSDGVRDFFSDNALFWAQYYHLDGLRLDAIHMVFDMGAVHFWEYTREKINEFTKNLGRPFYLVAESDLNSPRVVEPVANGGYGFDAQWLDDFHHALYVLLNEAGLKRYEDFGAKEQLAKALKEGYVHSGEYVKFRKKKHGRSSAKVPVDHFVAFIQNHDQIGNHPRGQRLANLIDIERLKAGVAVLLLSPYVPLLFMGEEYGEDNPFYYFVSHSDTDLIESVRKGRKEEFASHWDTEPPDPQAEDTFNQSKLAWNKREKGHHHLLLEWYKQLIKLRKTQPALKSVNKEDIKVKIEEDKLLVMHRLYGQDEMMCLFNLSEADVTYTVGKTPVVWQKLLDSTQKKWLAAEKVNASSEEKTAQKMAPEQLKPQHTLTLAPWSVFVYKKEVNR